jgi:hypothetical protein
MITLPLVYDPEITGMVPFIKPGPSAWRSMAQIKNAKGYPLDLISAIGLHVDWSGCVSFLDFVRPKQSTGAPWLLA